MKIILGLILASTLAFTISCSRGGADDKPPSPNNGVMGQYNGVMGQWKSGGLDIDISTSSMKLSFMCQATNQQVQGDVAISVSSTEITIQEDKAVGSGQCALNFQKGTKIPYSVVGNELNLQVDQNQTLKAVRPGTTPSNGNNGNNSGNNSQGNNGNNNGNTGNGSTQAKMSAELFSGPGCAGQKMSYTQGMRCTALNGNIRSLRLMNGQCAELEEMSAQEYCEIVNQRQQ